MVNSMPKNYYLKLLLINMVLYIKQLNDHFEKIIF